MTLDETRLSEDWKHSTRDRGFLFLLITSKVPESQELIFPIKLTGLKM